MASITTWWLNTLTVYIENCESVKIDQQVTWEKRRTNSWCVRTTKESSRIMYFRDGRNVPSTCFDIPDRLDSFLVEWGPRYPGSNMLPRCYPRGAFCLICVSRLDCFTISFSKLEILALSIASKVSKLGIKTKVRNEWNHSKHGESEPSPLCRIIYTFENISCNPPN